MGQGTGLACGFWRWFLLRDHFSLAGRFCFSEEFVFPTRRRVRYLPAAEQEVENL